MPFRFHKTIKIAPGVKFNFNKKSASMSFGGKHAGFTISPSTGANIRASAYGTGLSYRKKVGGQKKRRVNNGTAEQRRLLHDVRELEDTLELLQAEEELDAALDAKMAPIGGKCAKRENAGSRTLQTRDIRCRENGCYRWRNNERTGAWVPGLDFL